MLSCVCVNMNKMNIFVSAYFKIDAQFLLVQNLKRVLMFASKNKAIISCVVELLHKFYQFKSRVPRINKISCDFIYLETYRISITLSLKIIIPPSITLFIRIRFNT